jgi:uncharacterized membrane protein (UPF0127 family)
LLVAAVAAATIFGCHKESAAPLETVAVNGHAWHVELALTPEQQHEGLAHRSSLPPDHGMLFVFEQAQMHQFYMLNCRMAIDIAYLGSDHRVICTYTMYPEPGVAEGDLKLYSSVEPAQFALEVAGGDILRAGVKPGQQVEFSAGVAGAVKAQPFTGR